MTKQEVKKKLLNKYFCINVPYLKTTSIFKIIDINFDENSQYVYFSYFDTEFPDNTINTIHKESDGIDLFLLKTFIGNSYDEVKLFLELREVL